MSRYQFLGLLSSILLLFLGIFLWTTVRYASNLHYTGICFVFVGLSIGITSLTSWLNERYHRTPLLAGGLIMAGLLFFVGLVFGLITYMY